jgi:hypothetical protein
MVAQVRMQPILVVEYSDVLKDIVLRLLTSLIMLPLNSLLLEATEETLNHCVVPAVSLPAHASFEFIGF